jgi:hypothetical protein
MKIIHAANVVTTSIFAMLLLAQLNVTANARGNGSGVHSFHFSGHSNSTFQHGHSARPHRAFGQWAPYGGIVAVSPYAPDEAMTYTTPEPVVFVPILQRALSCHKSKQTVTVPSEDGGTREITITRC